MGQTGTICFELIDPKTKGHVFGASVLVTDALGNKTLATTITDAAEKCFSGVPTGRLNIEIRHANYRTVLYKNVQLGQMGDTALIKSVLSQSPVDCPADGGKTRCPHCQSSRKVLPIKPGLVVHYNLETERAVKRYDHKRARLNYELYHDGSQEVVIGVWIPGEKEKFWDFQHCWFCTKCRRVF